MHTLFLFLAISISSNTYNSSACTGETITLRADSAGNADFFQWYRDGKLLTGDTTATLQVTVSNTKHTYSVTSRRSAPIIGNNLFENGSFETEFTKVSDSHFGSDYKYNYGQNWGWNPKDIYNKSGAQGANNLFVISSNANETWRDYLPIKADDGNYFALFDAGKEGKAWYANTTGNKNLVIQKGRRYVFSYSAVNINLHNSTNPYKATYDISSNTVSKQWTEVYCYMWDSISGTKILGEWPGAKAKKSSGTTYEVDLPNRPAGSWKMVWNNGVGGKTGQTADLCYNPTDTVDYNPAKLVFKVKDLNSGKEYPLATIDLSCHNQASAHRWIRKEAIFVPDFSSNNIEINVTNLTQATAGNDFGLDRIMFQHDDYTNARTVDSTIFVVKAQAGVSLYRKWEDMVICPDPEGDIVKYQWLVNGVAVEGATEQFILLTDTNALVQVQTTNQKGDVSLSCPIAAAKLQYSRNEAEKRIIATNQRLKIAPNPVHPGEPFTILAEDIEPTEVLIVSPDGTRHTITGTISNTITTNLPSGFYILRVIDGPTSQPFTTPLIIQQ